MRKAVVKTPNGNQLTRPLNLLYPLELQIVSSEDTEEEAKPKTNDTNGRPFADAPSSQQPNPKNVQYNLRTRKVSTQSSVHLGFFVALVTMSLFGVAASNEYGKCPLIYMQKVDSEKCVSSGITVFQTKQGFLCGQVQRCPSGHLDGMGNCGAYCHCPKWATQCTHYEQTHDSLDPTASGDIGAILEAESPSVCSFKKDPRCDDQPVHARFNMIQLSSGSRHYVRNLQIQIEEATEKEFICFGQGTITGSELFCRTHRCSENATRYCYHKRNNQAFFLSASLEGKIPITAWGTVNVVIYKSQNVLPQTPLCTSCHLQCVKGGIEINMDRNMGLMEICSLPFCYKISRPQDVETVLFPAEVSLRKHTFDVKIYSNGYLIKDFGIECEPDPFCESITCFLCWNRVLNPKCFPNYILVFTFILMY